MAHVFTGNEAKRLSRETGLSYDEAALVLKRAGGDYKAAMRLYINERNIHVEPEKVEDNERSMLHERLHAVLHGVKAAVGGILADRRFRQALILIVMMIAICTVPYIAVPAIMVGLFLRCRFSAAPWFG